MVSYAYMPSTFDEVPIIRFCTLSFILPAT